MAGPYKVDGTLGIKCMNELNREQAVAHPLVQFCTALQSAHRDSRIADSPFGRDVDGKLLKAEYTLNDQYLIC